MGAAADGGAWVDVSCPGCELLPAESRGARVNVLDGDTRKQRLGRVDFRFELATRQATVSKGETVHAAGTVASVEAMNSRSWRLLMEDGTAWIVLESGCGCGS